MKPAQIKRYRKNSKLIPTMMVKSNPVMLLGVSLPFIIATAISLKSAAAMSLEFLFINLVVSLVSVPIRRLIPAWIRVMINVGVATLAMMLSRYVISLILPDVYNNLGIYLYLMAINGVAILQSEPRHRRANLRRDLVESMRNVGLHTIAFAVMMFVVALPRELFGAGTFWGIPVNLPFRMPGMLLPFFGFIITGFLLAIIKFLTKRFAFLSASEAQRRESRDAQRYTKIRVDL